MRYKLKYSLDYSTRKQNSSGHLQLNQNQISYEVQTMFANLMKRRLCPETLSELRTLFGFDIIEGFWNCLSEMSVTL